MDAYIVEAIRTPRTRIKTGGLAQIPPIQLVTNLIEAMESRQPALKEALESIILGCVHAIGPQGSNIAKISSVYAGLPNRVHGATVNSFCGSGLEAIHMAAARVTALGEGMVLAGGVESLSQVPMFSDQGAWFSDEDVAEKTQFLNMGVAADLMACQENYSRTELDKLGATSHLRAKNAQKQGHFEDAIIPQCTADGKLIKLDDGPIEEADSFDFAQKTPRFRPTNKEFSRLKTALKDSVTFEARHHSGTSPLLVDGASLVLIANEKTLRQFDLKPKARILGGSGSGSDPLEMLTGHIAATKKLLTAHHMTPQDVDLFEINESFAASVLKYMDAFTIKQNRINLSGGAIALGHPLGATGGMLIGQLIGALAREEKKIGLAAIPGGAGNGIATLIEGIY